MDAEGQLAVARKRMAERGVNVPAPQLRRTSRQERWLALEREGGNDFVRLARRRDGEEEDLGRYPISRVLSALRQAKESLRQGR